MKHSGTSEGTSEGTHRQGGIGVRKQNIESLTKKQRIGEVNISEVQKCNYPASIITENR